LLDQGASKVYAGARDPDTIKVAGVIPVRLDITSPADVAAAVAQCGDTTLVVNNAGILTGTSVLADARFEGGRASSRRTCSAPFDESPSPRCSGRTVVGDHQRLSVLSVQRPGRSAVLRESAAWSLATHCGSTSSTNTHRSLPCIGYMDTDMAAGVDAPKASPDDVAAQALAGVEAGAFEVLADDTSRYVRGGLSGDLTALYPALVATTP
jgi:hypothetical protein